MRNIQLILFSNLFIFISLFIINDFDIKLNNIRTQEAEKILWASDKKLKWSDFEGAKKFSKLNSVAVTQCEIVILDIKVVNGLPLIKVANFFDKKESWTTTDEQWALDHEQLHFDIYELFTRKIRKDFKRLNDLGVIDINEYQKAYDNFIEQAEKMNEKYDKEVYFNLEMQNNWSKSIENELIKLKEYELKE